MCTHWLHWLHGQLRGGGGVCCTCVFAARRGIFAACARKKRMKLHRTWPLDSLPSTAPQVRPHLICCCWCRCSQPLFLFTLTFPFLTPFASCRVAGDMVYDQFDDDVSRSKLDTRLTHIGVRAHEREKHHEHDANCCSRANSHTINSPACHAYATSPWKRLLPTRCLRAPLVCSLRSTAKVIDSHSRAVPPQASSQMALISTLLHPLLHTHTHTNTHSHKHTLTHTLSLRLRMRQG